MQAKKYEKEKEIIDRNNQAQLKKQIEEIKAQSPNTRMTMNTEIKLPGKSPQGNNNSKSIKQLIQNKRKATFKQKNEAYEFYREESEDLTLQLYKAEGIKLTDGFQIPIKFCNTRIGQTFLRKTPKGFYKSTYMILSNQELYIYNSKKNQDYKDLLIMTPGVFIKALPAISLSPQDIQQKIYEYEHQKVYPIEIHLGGSTGNVGVE